MKILGSFVIGPRGKDKTRMPEMKRLLVSAVHAVRRPANRRPWLLVKADTTPTDKGEQGMALTDKEVEALQTTLDTPLEKEDELWKKLEPAAKGSALVESQVRSGLRLLKKAADETGADLSEVLTEAGILPEVEDNGDDAAAVKDKDAKAKAAAKTKADAEAKVKAASSTTIELPEDVALMLKEAGPETTVAVLKSMSGSPEVANAVLPVLGLLASIVRKGESDAHLQKIQKAVDDMGIKGNREEQIKMLADMNDAQLEAFTKVFGSGIAQVKEAQSLLFKEHGTEAEGEVTRGAYAKALKMAKDKVTKSEAKDSDEALAQVWKENPDLYELHRRESSGMVSPTGGEQ